MDDLRQLFEHELRDLYSAENQLLQAFPQLQKNASDQDLRSVFDEHMTETEKHKSRIEDICKDLNITPQGGTCKAMEGLIKEVNSFLRKDHRKEVKDEGLIAEAQRIEHYEISGYGTAARYAKELGMKDIAEKLHRTLEEERKTDEKLNGLAENRLNQEAKK